MAEAGRTGSGWRGGKLLALGEIALVVGIFIADRHRLIPLSKTPFLLALGWVSLRIRNLRWVDLGFARFRNWPVTLAIGAAAGAAMELLDLFVTKPLEVRVFGRPPDLSDFLPLVGNLKLFLLALVAVWVLAALGEELVWRGYLLNRVAELLGSTRASWAASAILVSAAFGFAHAYQGLSGIAQEGFSGLLLALLYLACGRSLAVPIVAHGVTDTIDVVLIFTGSYPGLPIH
jgi:membrane protease YdiL (CAAX protease family)